MSKIWSRRFPLYAILLAVPAVAAAQPARPMAPRPAVVVRPGVDVRTNIGPVVRLPQAPPAPRMEVRGPQPSPNHLWVAGYWNWANNQHAWVPGRWEVRRPGAQWVDSHWVHDRGQWAFYAGRWLETDAPYHPEVTVTTAPPTPQYEIAPDAVDPGHEWIGGHYEWHNAHHVWIPGRYELRPEHMHWRDHRWERIDEGHYRFHRGGWRRDE